TAAAATAVAAFYQQITVACIEPAVSADIAEPQSSDDNRKIIRTLASLHFTPTEAIGRDLAAAGVPLERIVVTGNTTAGTLHAAAQLSNADGTLSSEFARGCKFLRADSPLLLVTECDENEYGFEPLCRALRKVALQRRDLD